MQHQLTPPIHAGPAWQYHFLNLSVADLIVVVLMIVVFALAVLIPFPGHNQQVNQPPATWSGSQPGDTAAGRTEGPTDGPSTPPSANKPRNGGDLS